MRPKNTFSANILPSSIMLATVAIALVSFTMCSPKTDRYISNQGNVFGTTYHIKYQAGNDLEDTIRYVLQQVDNSLSVFNPQSTLSKINNGETQTDEYFRFMYNKAAEINRVSDGALDITVSPLINAWGFGTVDKPYADPHVIDSILAFVGFGKIHLQNEQLIKDDPRITLNASAIAKGYGCDIVAQLLESQDIANYMVEIGGEVVCKGVNANGKTWNIGITTPEDDPSGQTKTTQAIITGDLALATSGSYRQFYFDEDNVRRSHTIDPRTGYPVSNDLLSATIIAPDCMTADGLATACMVMGLTESLKMIEQLPDVECYLIYDINGQHLVQQSEGFAKYFAE